MEKAKFLVFDTEVANCPKIDGQLDVANGQFYDLGLQIVDKDGYVYDQYSIVNEDVFFGMPEAMQNAYFAEKIPNYLTEMRNATRKIVDTWEMWRIVTDMCKKYDVAAIIAHNAWFDVKTLNATIRYQTKSKKRYFLPYGIPILDTMKMANEMICKTDDYITFCKEHNYMTNHPIPRPRKTAEVLYRYLTGNNDFEEQHTGLEDVKIETEIFLECVRRGFPLPR